MLRLSLPLGMYLTMKVVPIQPIFQCMIYHGDMTVVCGFTLNLFDFSLVKYKVRSLDWYNLKSIYASNTIYCIGASIRNSSI